LEETLKDYFGYSTFRPGQRRIVETILAQKDGLVVMPTGGGKSLCYQLPALLLEGTALVISPLISLMKDQVDELKVLGIPAQCLHGNLEKHEEQNIIDSLLKGELKILYISPERFSINYFIQLLKRIKLSFVAIDEAHCISQWGHDFRPSYLTIRESIDRINASLSVCAFTATATNAVKKDIIDKLNLKNPLVHLGGFNRENIFFSLYKPKDKRKWLLKNLNHDLSTIIFCNTRKRVEEIYHFLKDHYFEVTYYHAGLSKEEREKSQDDFIFDRKTIIVATNAFGMGIDKSNVRQVIHYNMPQSIESYYQEAGRAGRDGAKAEAILLFSAQDIIVAKFFVEKSKQPKIQEKLQQMIGYTYTTSCLRQYILNYFGDHIESCGDCTTCVGDFVKTDITKEAQMILSTVARSGQQYGMSSIVDCLKGANNEKVRRLALNNLSTYGLMKTYQVEDIRDIISLLVYEGYLKISGEEYPQLKLRQQSEEILFKQQKLYINKELSQNKVLTEALYLDKTLFSQLKILRQKIATNLELAPYLIFSDKTLEEMAKRKPKSNEDFLDITGVGQKKLKQYGTAFLSVIKHSS